MPVLVGTRHIKATRRPQNGPRVLVLPIRSILEPYSVVVTASFGRGSTILFPAPPTITTGKSATHRTRYLHRPRQFPPSRSITRSRVASSVHPATAKAP